MLSEAVEGDGDRDDDGDNSAEGIIKLMAKSKGGRLRSNIPVGICKEE